MKIIGVVLIILGLLRFLFGSISFQQEETVADLGPVEIEKEETRTIPIAPLASGGAVIAGIVLVEVGMRDKYPHDQVR